MKQLILCLLLVAVFGCGQQGAPGKDGSGLSNDESQSSNYGSEIYEYASPSNSTSSSAELDAATIETKLRDFAQQTLKKSNGYKKYTNWSEPIIRIEHSNSLTYPYNGRLQWTNSGPNTLRRRFLFEASSQQWRIGKWYDDGSGQDAFTAGVQSDFDF